MFLEAKKVLLQKKKKVNSAWEKKKKKTDAFPQHIDQSFDSLRLVFKGPGVLAKQAYLGFLGQAGTLP